MAVVVTVGCEEGDHGSVSDSDKWSWLIKDEDESVNMKKYILVVDNIRVII